MGQIRRYRPEDCDAEQRRLYDEIVGGRRGQGGHPFPIADAEGRLNGPFNAMLTSPAVGTALQGLGAALRFSSSLPDRARELAILAVAAHWASDFERQAHEAVARRVGWSDDALAELRDGRCPESANDLEQVVFDVVTELLGGQLSPTTFDRAAGAIGDHGIFDVTTLVGYYQLLALQLRVFDVDPAPTGKGRP